MLKRTPWLLPDPGVKGGPRQHGATSRSVAQATTLTPVPGAENMCGLHLTGNAALPASALPGPPSDFCRCWSLWPLLLADTACSHSGLPTGTEAYANFQLKCVLGFSKLKFCNNLLGCSSSSSWKASSGCFRLHLFKDMSKGAPAQKGPRSRSSCGSASQAADQDAYSPCQSTQDRIPLVNSFLFFILVFIFIGHNGWS